MFQKFREFMTMLAPPYDGPSYMDRMAAREAARVRLRDEFAMAALPAIIQNKGIQTTTLAAEVAYAMADAMMEEREAE